ncbi:MAG: cobalamin biosynthesis protein CobW [Candidatus Symbiobacter sp.]|nr:cobalamin biosynthesis protein CobW [Candidatus Symbiobacter sp.]
MAFKIPVTVITGFLGAGKTTLVADMLRQSLALAHRPRLALIINEFGECGIDRALVEGGGEGGDTAQATAMEELANGCICCKVADDFIPTMEKLLAITPPIDHIIIETSGLALPKPLIAAFNWPEISAQVTVDGVIAVVDAAALASGLFAAPPPPVSDPTDPDAIDHENPSWEVFTDQIAAADVIILNKIDLVDEENRQKLISQLKAESRPGVSILTARQANLPLAVTIGLQVRAENDLAARPSLHDGLDAHDHDDFASVVVRFDVVSQDPAALAKKLTAIATAHHLLRLKGFVAVAGKNRRLVIQAVGGRVEHYFDRPWRGGESPNSVLVAIGLNPIDPIAITDAINHAVTGGF